MASTTFRPSGFADVLGQYSDVAQAEALAQERLRQELLADQERMLQPYNTPESQAGASIGFNLMRGFADGLGLGGSIDDDPLVMEARATREALSGLQSIQASPGTKEWYLEAAKRLYKLRPDMAMQLTEQARAVSREQEALQREERWRQEDRTDRRTEAQAAREFQSGMAMYGQEAAQNTLAAEQAFRREEGAADRATTLAAAGLRANASRQAAAQKQQIAQIKDFVAQAEKAYDKNAVFTALNRVRPSGNKPLSAEAKDEAESFATDLSNIVGQTVGLMGRRRMQANLPAYSAQELPGLMDAIVGKLQQEGLISADTSGWLGTGDATVDTSDMLRQHAFQIAAEEYRNWAQALDTGKALPEYAKPANTQEELVLDFSGADNVQRSFDGGGMGTL